MNARSLILVTLLLAGCSSRPALVLPHVTPYKMDIQQGNLVTQEMIAKLQPGMTRNQVRFALGTPLVVDPFRTDRWDYVFLYQKAGVVTEHRKIAVIFKDDKLLRIEGDIVPAAPGPSAPSGAAADKPPAAAVKPGPVPPIAAPPQPEGARLVTGTGEPVASGGVSAEAAAGAEKSKEEKAKEEKPKEEKPAEERGFFGRMLERLGF